MTQPEPQADPLAEPIPAFRLAFAIVGTLVFGSTALVGVVALVAGGYTTSLRCDRAAQTCKIQYRSAEKSFPIRDLDSAEHRHEDRGSARGGSEELYISYTSGKKDFLCALPADSGEAGSKIEAHAAEIRSFLKDDKQPALDIQCQGKVSGLAQGLAMIGLSALLTTASGLTLVRGVRQMMRRQAPGKKL